MDGVVYYTMEEGSEWLPGESALDKDAIIEGLEYSRDVDEDRRWSSYLEVGKGNMVDVAAVLFPDGDVWDAYSGQIRENDIGVYNYLEMRRTWPSGFKVVKFDG